MTQVGSTAFKAMLSGVGGDGIPGHIRLYPDFLPDTCCLRKVGKENGSSSKSSLESNYVGSSGR